MLLSNVTNDYAGIQWATAYENVQSLQDVGNKLNQDVDFAKFLDVSIKSDSELEYGLQLARDNGVLPEHAWRTLAGETIEIRKMLCVFRRKVLQGGI